MKQLAIKAVEALGVHPPAFAAFGETVYRVSCLYHVISVAADACADITRIYNQGNVLA
jgi:hypothetical protein